MVHYRSWCKSIEVIMSGLYSSILVRDPDTQVILKNKTRQSKIINFFSGIVYKF